MPEPTRPEPNRAFRWLVLIFVSLTMFGNYYVYDCIAPLADVLARQLGFSDSNIGLMQAIYSIPNVFMVLIGGYIVDRLGTRKAIFLFGSLCLVGAAVTTYPDSLMLQKIVVGLVNTFVPLIRIVGHTPLLPHWLADLSGVQTQRGALVASMAAGRLTFGMGAESLIVAVTTAIAKWFRGKELSFAFGINLMIARFGSWLAQNSPTWASSSYSNWRSPLLISVAFGTFCVIGAVIYWAMELYAEKKYAVGQAGSTDKVVFRDIYKFGLSYWYVVALCIVFYSAIFPFETFAIKFFIEAHGTSRELGGFLVSILTAFTMFGTPAFGLFVDKLGKRALLMMLGSMLLIPVYLMMAYTHISLYVPMAMMGIAFSLIPAVMWPSVAYLVDQSKLGTAYGLMTMIQNIGLAGFNLLVGWANDRGHAGPDNPAGYHLGMWIFSTLGFLGVLFAFLLHERETGPQGHGLETITTAKTA